MRELRLLTAAETAEFLGLTKKTLAEWRCQRKGPPWIKIGGRVRYAPTQVERWVERHCTRDPEKALAPNRLRAKQEPNRRFSIRASAGRRS